MELNSYYCLVKKVEEPKKEGFQEVEIQDSFVYKGQIVRTPGAPSYIGNYALAIGDIIVFAKYSPDTVEIEFDKEKQKFVKITDILAVL